MSDVVLIEPPLAANVPTTTYEVALLALMDSLACAFQALQQPACTRLLGPVVPGATMTFGARVPGTSYQLDPVQAAFNLGTMAGWLDLQDPALAPRGLHFADALGALLPMGDYLARKALAEGKTPATVHDLLAALLDAQRRQSDAVDMRQTLGIATADRCSAIRLACATTVASMLGGTQAQIVRAFSLAAGESRAQDAGDTRPQWWLGDANARGVRLALMAVAEAPDPGGYLPHDRAPGFAQHRATDPSLLSLPPSAQGPVPHAAATSRIRDRFMASVTSHFPAVQAEKIRTTFADRARLESLPINEMVSLTVRN